MKKLSLLAFSNIRRAKGQMVILFLIFLIAATLLNSGLAIMFGFNSHFDELTEELNTPDTHFILSEHLFNDDVYQLLHSETTEFAVHDGLQFAINFPAAMEDDDTLHFRGSVVFDVSDVRTLSQWKLVGDSFPMTENGAYLSYLLYAGRGYTLGQEITLILNDIPHNFVIEGFVEPL